jgi:hypothetical protein
LSHLAVRPGRACAAARSRGRNLATCDSFA